MMLRKMIPALLLVSVGWGGPAEAADPESVLERPPELEVDVAFWRRVYTEISSDQGFVHDDWRLDIVYETLELPEHASHPTRRALYRKGVRHYRKILRTLATGKRDGLSEDEHRVLALWGEDVDNATLDAASRRVRFQLGQSDRFREGLVRSGLWRDYIRTTLEEAGVPLALAALPHVESSFNPRARSHMGAAGMWQFMPSTGRRYLRIDHVVDERLDPYRSTEAAALLLAHNYAVTGTWPLAITAYNHGAAGMRRAAAEVGSSAIEDVVRQYHGPAFGFASRNFYVAFLAAYDVSSDPERYFGPVERRPSDPSLAVTLPAYVPVAALTSAFGVAPDKLRYLNPSLSRLVWSGEKHVPEGFTLRVPAAHGDDAGTLLAAIPPGDRFDAQTPDYYHVVARGETLSGIAPRYGARVSELVRLNALASRDRIRIGQKLLLPAAAKAGLIEAPAPKAVPAVAVQAQSETSEQAVEEWGEQPELAADPSDYSVAGDHTIRVQENETLGHYAEWLNIRASDLRRLNTMRGSALVVGQRLKISLAEASAETFEARRLAYHERLQSAFFAAWRISGTLSHVVRSGESIWVLAQRRYDVPVWLLRQYNPDVDLARVRPGTRLVFPILEAAG